jgi:glycine/D-amino acid oxidase-like deaminating enzyme
VTGSGAFDVVVVGGGIVGASAAAFLSAAGASVLLVERDGLASGASGANSGVVQHPFDPVLATLYRETVSLYRSLAAVSNSFAFGERPAGLLYISAEEAAARDQARLIGAAFPSLGLEVLGGEELRRVEPAAGPDLWACRLDIGYPVMPGASTYAYATLAESRGTVVRMGRAASLEVVGDTVVGVRVNGDVVTAGAVLVAAGPWTPGLLDPSGRWSPIRARWGVVVEAELAEPPVHVLEEAGIEAVLDTVAGTQGPAPDNGSPEPAADGAGVEFSLVPLAGAAAVGSTFLAAEPDPSAWMEAILVRASRFVPGVADAPIRGVRACARPQSDDGRPLIGAVPGRRNLFVCAGHGPWGISTGPASARLVADLVLGLEPDIPVELDPARFGTPGG